MPGRRFAFAFLIILLAVSPVAGKPAPERPAPERRGNARRLVPDTPRAAVRCMAQAYNDRSLEGLDALLSADYRFHFSSGDSAGMGYLNGLDRSRELRAARGWFEGFVTADGSVIPPPSKLRFTLGRLDEGADPEHPDSLSHYRVVVAHKMKFDIVAGDTMESLPADQVFYLVRGDIAARLEGQPGLASRWYLRRWLENLAEVERRLAEVDGHCEDAAKLAADAALAGAFGVRPLDSPLCPTLDVVCDLPVAEPATLEVYDLQGRRMAKQVLNPAAPGTVRVQAGSGTRFAPGAYWLRLTQGRRPPSKRLVIVAR